MPLLDPGTVAWVMYPVRVKGRKLKMVPWPTTYIGPAAADDVKVSGRKVPGPHSLFRVMGWPPASAPSVNLLPTLLAFASFPVLVFNVLMHYTALL